MSFNKIISGGMRAEIGDPEKLLPTPTIKLLPTATINTYTY